MRVTLPVDIEANIEVNGLIAYAEITQTFINPHAIALEGKYQFPLPENSAVQQLFIKMDDKEIIGEIIEKKAAKTLYQKAKKQGQKASLLEQERPNIFTNKIANIPPQSTVVVTLKIIMPVMFSNGNFNLRLPLVITQRYQPDLSKELPEPFKFSASHLWASDSSETDFLFTNIRSLARSQSSINIELNSGVAITEVVSGSHSITSRAVNHSQNAYVITLNKTQVISDRSFELSWQLLTSEQPQVSSFTQEVEGEHYTLLSIFPPTPTAAQVLARDIIFIIDTSGSMQGSTMEQAKASLQLAISQLNVNDSFNIIAFDDDTELLFPITQMTTTQHIKQARDFIHNLNADGGTQMYRPLSNALIMKKNELQSVNAIRQIVFITDGAVANEFELMQLLNTAQGDFRLYTVGIGAAPNGYFMKKAAQFGRGSYVFIQNSREVQQKMSNFMTKISQPAISNIQLKLNSQVHQQVEMYPEKLPDLYFGEPLQIALKSELPISRVQVAAHTASTPWQQEIIIDNHHLSKGISSLWARRKIEDLVDSLVIGANKDKVKSEVITTSLTHQILSPYTSFIAVEKQRDDLPLYAKNIDSTDKNLLQSQQNLMVAMPKTAIGWQLQFFIGIALLLLLKINNFSWLMQVKTKANSGFAKITENRREKTH